MKRARLIIMLFFMIGLSFGQIAPKDTFVKKKPIINYISSVGGSIYGEESYYFNPSLSRILPVSLYLQKFDIQHFITIGVLWHENYKDVGYTETRGRIYGSETESYEGNYLLYEMHKLTSANSKGSSVGGLAGVGLTRYLSKKLVTTQLLDYETQIFEESEETRKRKSGTGFILTTGLVFQKSPFILEARANFRPSVTKSHIFFTINGGLGTKSLIGAVGAHALWILPYMAVVVSFFVLTNPH